MERPNDVEIEITTNGRKLKIWNRKQLSIKTNSDEDAQMHEICSFLRDDLNSKDATQIPKYYIRGEMKKTDSVASEQFVSALFRWIRL